MFIGSAARLYGLTKRVWMTPERLQEIQDDKLRRVVMHAYENVPYYHRLFDSVSVKPQEIRSANDLVKIPVTTKKQIQSMPTQEMIAGGMDIRRCREMKTSGSTGIPLSLFFTEREIETQGLVWARACLANGQRIWDRTAYLKFKFQRNMWFQRIGIWKRYDVPLGLPVEEQAKILARSEPDILRGFTDYIFFLARAIDENKIERITPRLVFGTAYQTDEKRREFIESIFGAEFFDYYGATEFGCIAWECSSHSGYHINTDAVVVEVLRDGMQAPPGTMGRIVCTALDSYAMPMIRYDLGDAGVTTERRCPCGRSLPLLDAIHGRMDDLFVSPTGRVFPSPGLITYLRDVEGIGEFRVIQESREKIIVKIVPGKGFSARTREEVGETAKRVFGSEYKIQVEIIDAMPPDASGKMRVVISKVPKDI